MLTGQKHLIKCRCVLPQYKHVTSPPRHQFIVFSVIDENGNVKPKFAQCNNCALIHKVYDFCTSEILQGKEAMSSIMRIEDIKPNLSSNLVSVLETNNADLPTWEAVHLIIQTKNWGQFVVLTTDTDGETKQGKYVRILGENLINVETFMREEVVR